MKIILTTTFLVLFLGTILCITSDAKVLPVIEGSELLDTLAAQNNEDLNNLPELTAGNYKNVEGSCLFSPQNYFLKERLIYDFQWICNLTLLYSSFDSTLNLQSDNKSMVNTAIQLYFLPPDHDS